jgi:hypothetical protein
VALPHNDRKWTNKNKGGFRPWSKNLSHRVAFLARILLLPQYMWRSFYGTPELLVAKARAKLAQYAPVLLLQRAYSGRWLRHAIITCVCVQRTRRTIWAQATPNIACTVFLSRFFLCKEDEINAWRHHESGCHGHSPLTLSGTMQHPRRPGMRCRCSH